MDTRESWRAAWRRARMARWLASDPLAVSAFRCQLARGLPDPLAVAAAQRHLVRTLGDYLLHGNRSAREPRGILNAVWAAGIVAAAPKMAPGRGDVPMPPSAWPGPKMPPDYRYLDPGWKGKPYRKR